MIDFLGLYLKEQVAYVYTVPELDKILGSLCIYYEKFTTVADSNSSWPLVNILTATRVVVIAPF